MLPKVEVPIPGPRSRELAESLARHESRNVTCLHEPFPVFWERAEGVNVWDVDGNRYLDLTSAFAVTGLGHTRAEIRDALVRQAGKLSHAMGDVHPSRNKALLCRRLSEITFERWQPGLWGKTVLATSGSEAVEAALKTALLHSGKRGVLSFTGAYHGLGYGSLEAGGIDFFRRPFASQLAGFSFTLPYPSCFRCPFGRREDFRLSGDPFPDCNSTCLEELGKQIGDALGDRDIGCVLVEPVQGRGGDVVPPRNFLRLLRRLCDTHGIPLVLDEIYTGFNRTGELFACDHVGVIPDLICLGKGMTNGFPMGACVGRADIMDAWPESEGEALHTGTFLGHPLGCAAALAAIDLHTRPETAARVRAAGQHFKDALRRIVSPGVGEVRGIGLMLGMEIVRENGEPHPELAAACVNQGLRDGLLFLAGSPAGNVLSFSPPFDIRAEEIEFTAGKLQEYLTSLPGSVS